MWLNICICPFCQNRLSLQALTSWNGFLFALEIHKASINKQFTAFSFSPSRNQRCPFVSQFSILWLIYNKTLPGKPWKGDRGSCVKDARLPWQGWGSRCRREWRWRGIWKRRSWTTSCWPHLPPGHRLCSSALQTYLSLWQHLWRRT